MEDNQGANSQDGNQSSNENQGTQDQVITEALVKDMGLPKEMAGKPLSDLSKNYKNLVSKLTQTSQELSELKKKPKDPEPSDESEPPDPFGYDEPKAYQKAFKAWKAREDKKLLESFKTQISSEMEPIRNYFRDSQTKDFLSTLQQDLGPGIDASKLVEEWLTDNELTTEDIKLFGNPKLLKKQVINFHDAKRLKEISTDIEKETGDKVIEKIKASLKGQKNQSDFNSVDKKYSTKPQGQVDRILKSLEDEQSFME